LYTRILEVLWVFAVACRYYDKARKLAFGYPCYKRSCGGICWVSLPLCFQ